MFQDIFFPTYSYIFFQWKIFQICLQDYRFFIPPMLCSCGDTLHRAEGGIHVLAGLTPSSQAVWSLLRTPLTNKANWKNDMLGNDYNFSLKPSCALADSQITLFANYRWNVLYGQSYDDPFSNPILNSSRHYLKLLPTKMYQQI